MAEFTQIADDFGWWVTGLVDGEGCFYAGLSFRQKQTSSGRLVSCVNSEIQFAVALRADDVATVEKLKNYFGCGRVGNKRSAADSPSCKKAGIKPHPQKRYVVSNLDEIIGKVIPHFDQFPLQSKKARDFDTWKNIVGFIASELRGSRGWIRRHPDKVAHLQSMCDQMKNDRKFPAQLTIAGGAQ